ncbi:MAG TPA: IS1182 family transposase [Acetobacteraceae bacterium]|nr:IS1182 family transposase [Acetobacteraceae bacterium]
MSELFDHLPDQPTPAPAGLAGPRLRRPDRDQMILCPGSLDALLPAEHMVRSVEAFVGTLDLSPLYHAIRAREGTPGHPPADPRLIVALWLYATIDGVGSARELARLCDTALPYQWLCGGVSVNHHSLSDARLACAAWLDQALISSIAVLCQAGAVTLNTVAQDGLRVRASAGAGSFRRRPTLQRCLAEAKAQVETLKRELDGDARASLSRREAAVRRAAADRARRLEQAVAALPEAEARAVRNKKKAEEARVSMTDPEAVVMKMPDGGFRPAYNAQLAAETEHGLIVGLAVTSIGADQPSLEPMVAQIAARTGRRPDTVLVDGGYFNRDSVTRLTQAGVELLMPLREPKKADRDAGAPMDRDTAEVAALRSRMQDPPTRPRYQERARWIEWVNAGTRNRGLYWFGVRGLVKVRAVLGWQAMAHNFGCVLRSKALRAVFGSVEPRTA